MPKITFLYPNGSSKTVEAAKGLSVMEVAQKNDIQEIEGACGGGMACATCHVYVHPDWVQKCLPEGKRSAEEEDMLDLAFDVRDDSRLCCQIRVEDTIDGLIVALPGTKTGW